MDSNSHPYALCSVSTDILPDCNRLDHIICVFLIGKYSFILSEDSFWNNLLEGKKKEADAEISLNYKQGVYHFTCSQRASPSSFQELMAATVMQQRWTQSTTRSWHNVRCKHDDEVIFCHGIRENEEVTYHYSVRCARLLGLTVIYVCYFGFGLRLHWMFFGRADWASSTNQKLNKQTNQMNERRAKWRDLELSWTLLLHTNVDDLEGLKGCFKVIERWFLECFYWNSIHNYPHTQAT